MHRQQHPPPGDTTGDSSPVPATPKTCSGGASRAHPQLAKRQPPPTSRSLITAPGCGGAIRLRDGAGRGGVEQRASGHEAPVGWRGRDARGFPRAAANGSRGMGALSQ